MITSLPIIKQVDKVIGLLFGFIKVALLIYLVFFIVGLLVTIPSVNALIGTFIQNDLALTTEQFRLSKWIYNNNILSMIFGVFL